MLRRFLRFIVNLSIRTQIVLVFLLAFLFSSTASLFAMRYIVSTYERHLHDQLSITLGIVDSDIEVQVDNIMRVSEFLATHSVVQASLITLLEADDPLEVVYAKSELRRVLSVYSSYNKFINSITLVTDAEEFSAGSVQNQFSPSVLEGIIEAASASRGSAVIGSAGLEDSSIVCARSVRKIKNVELSNLGTLLISINLDQIIYDCLAAQPSGTRVLIWQDDGSALYPTGIGDLSDYSLLSDMESYQILRMDGIRQFVVARQSAKLHWYSALCLPYDTTFRAIINSQRIAMGVFAVSAGLAILCCWLVISRIMTHLNFLLLKIRSFRGDSEAIPVPESKRWDYSKSKNEVAILHIEFDDMRDQIQSLIHDNYSKRLLLVQTQLQMLYQQINPHFIFNTLNAISWEAKLHGEEHISYMTEQLAAMLSLTLEDASELVPLKRELTMLSHYLNIQKARYEGRLDYTQEIPSTLMSIQVPKMCIQPLVENAIQYGLERQIGQCSIRLSAYTQGLEVIIRVDNTGSEIDESIMEKLREGIYRTKDKGIGLNNIDKRIRLLFGEEYGVTVTSEEDASSVLLHFPLSVDAVEKEN